MYFTKQLIIMNQPVYLQTNKTILEVLHHKIVPPNTNLIKPHLLTDKSTMRKTRGKRILHLGTARFAMIQQSTGNQIQNKIKKKF